MPWDFEDVNDDALPGEKGMIDPRYKTVWPEGIWPWWRALFTETPKDLSLILRNVTGGGRTTEDRQPRRKEARPIFEAALLMLMLDSVTRKRTGPDAAAVEVFYRDNLLNVRQGDLVTFVDRLKARGVAEPAFTTLKQSDLRAKYGLADHGEFHDDLLRYLFQVDIIDSEIEGIWITPVMEVVEHGELGFRDTVAEAARLYIEYCYASPLRRLRMAIRASSPMVPLVRQCATLLVGEEHRYWVNVLDNLCAIHRMRPLVSDNITMAGFLLDYLTGAITNLQTLPDPTSDEAVASAVSGFMLFVTLYQSAGEDVADGDDASVVGSGNTEAKKDRDPAPARADDDAD